MVSQPPQGPISPGSAH